MFIAAIDFSITDIIVLQVLALILGVVVHFVWVSRRKLQNMLDESRKENSLTASSFQSDFKRTGEKKPATAERRRTVVEEEPFVRKPKAKPQRFSYTDTADPIDTLRDHIRQQQKSLDQLLRRVDSLDEEDTQYTEPVENNSGVKAQLERLELLLEKKEVELQKARQQLSASQKMTARIEDVYKEFDALQDKIASLEESAQQATRLAMELEEVKDSFQQTQKDLARKQEKLTSLQHENTRLQQKLNEATDKLQDAGLQKQQLLKKVEFLESMTSEFQQLSDVNKKMQQELKRIAELESMLSIVSDERDLLMKRRSHQ